MRVLLVGCLLAAAACQLPSEPEANRVMTRAALSVATSPSLDLGEDCSAQRQLCKSGQCLATVRAGRPTFVCTVICESDNECPVDFSCSEVAPRARVCVPGPDRVPARATVRLAVARVRPPAVDAGWNPELIEGSRQEVDGGR